MGRRGAVEVPRGRLCRPLGGAATSARSPRSPGRTRGTGLTASRSFARDSPPRRPSLRLTEADENRAQRQLGIVDGQGRAASYTGAECNDWAGHRTGAGYAAQGNILVSAATVDALAETFESSADRPLAERLLDCLDAAQAAGGDSRGQQSAAILVVGPEQGYAGLSDVVVDLRVDDHERPLEELRRLFGLHQQLFGADASLTLAHRRRRPTPGDRRPARRARLRAPRGLGGRRQPRGAHVEGEDRVDPVVLDALRRASN